jgi:glycosyltransferase involved in cell wall biosynthesis
MHLSAVIITLNEERNLERCLASLQGVADDILVVDSGSTDQTEAIARQGGAAFVFHAFEGYVLQKEWALRQAQGPWVLSLDADEALSDSLRASILAWKQSQPQARGYTMNRLNYYCGHWQRRAGWYPDTKLRLVEQVHARWGGMDPHDKMELTPGSLVQHLQGDLLHYTYYTVEEHRLQSRKFALRSAKAYVDQGKRVGWAKPWINAGWRFVKDYFLRLGWMDGVRGWTICTITAHGVWLKYAEMRRLQKEIAQSKRAG